MGVIERLFARDGRRVEVVIAPRSESVLSMTPEQLYAHQPALHAVVSFLARNIAQLPLKCYRMDGNDRRRVRDSTAALLLAKPNEHLTTYQLIERLVVDLKLRGWALWHVAEDVDSDSGWRIDPLPASWVTKTPTKDGFEPAYYKLCNPETDATAKVDAADCIRFAYYDPAHPSTAESPVDALKDVLAEQVSAWRFRNQVWARGGRVTSYITRPANSPWGPGAFDRFKNQWEEFRGNEGSGSGKTPILEDGMDFKTVAFNARESEWASATQLSRQDVAGVYHVNPAMVWSNDGQTYASAKDNARSLYADTLAPDLKMIADKINQALLPMLGAEPAEYVEFDIQAKLTGAFEEQAQQLYSAVGTPYMTVAEARARLNLPYIEGTDSIARPLNTAYNDDAQAETDTFAGPAEAKAASAPIKARGSAKTRDALEISSAMRKFFKRQAKSVLSQIDRAKDKGASLKAEDGFPPWWDAERWDRELADDLAPVFQRQAARRGRAALEQMGFEADEFDEPRIENYIAAMAAGKARAANNVTLRQLQAAIDGEVDEGAQGATVQGVFAKAEESRADAAGGSFATAVAGFAVMEAARQKAPERRKSKTWVVTSGNPRAEHAAMDGETVGFDEEFSNGAMWPGDQTLTPDQSCGCMCEVEITIF